MKLFHAVLFLVALALAFVPAALIADDNTSSGGHGRHGAGLHQTEKCLSTLNLSPALNASIQSSLTAGKATLQADGQSLRALHQKMESDIAAGADKSVVGQDTLNVDSARTKMKTDVQAIRDQVLAQLPADQQQAFNTCAAAHGPNAGSGRPHQ